MCIKLQKCIVGQLFEMGLTWAKIKVFVELLFWRWDWGLHFLAHSAVYRIQFFAIVGLRSLFPFCLKTKLFRTSRCSQKSLAPFLYFQSFKKESEVVQLCPTLCSPMDCSLPGSSLHGIFQARVLEWVAISFSRGPSRPRYQTHISCLAGGFFYR